MAFFHHSPFPADQTFTNLFRLLDDFDTYSRFNGPQHHKGGKGDRRSFSSIAGRPFNPCFDIYETENTYELHGELPGVDRKDVIIEFTEPQTVVVSGHIERSYTAGTPSEAAGSETFTHVDVPPVQSQEGGATKELKEHKEQKERHEAKAEEETTSAIDKSKTKEVSAPSAEKAVAWPTNRYWAMERAAGEFHRTFNFPLPVDEEKVKASLQNGILSISIPKLKRETRRIALEEEA